MATDVRPQDKPALHDIAGGWITEKPDTPVPMFLRIAYVVIATPGVAYLLMFIYGDVGNADRGPLIEQFNKSTHTSEPFMYIVAALVAVFGIAVSLFASKKGHE